MNEFFQRVLDFFSEPLYRWIGIGVGALIAVAVIVGIAVGVARSQRKKRRAARSAATNVAAAAPTEDGSACPPPEVSPDPRAESTAIEAESEAETTGAPAAETPAPPLAAGEPDATPTSESAPAENAPDESAPREPDAAPSPAGERDAAPATEPAPVDPPESQTRPGASDADWEKATPAAETVQTAAIREARPAGSAPVKSAAVRKTPAKKTAKPVQTVQKASLNTARGGKWVVKKQREDEFVACLHANNGELLLESEIYATAQGAKNGIDTIKKNVLLGNFGIHRDKNGNYFYKLKSGSNRLLCVGEVYSTKAACESAVDSVKRFSMRAPTATEIEEDLSVIEYVPKDTAIVAPKAGHTGKWQIKELDADTYVACLYANNGELLLASEDYASVAGAKAAIETIKKNAFANNFIIDRNKAGKFCYKLRNAAKSTLCVGEVYEKQAAVEQTIESVKRFCQTAVLEDVPDKKPAKA